MKKAAIGQDASVQNIPITVCPPDKGTKYRPLFDYLRRRPEEEVVMTLASVEIVLRTLLPKSASHPRWWAIEDGDHASRCWKAAGFLAELLRGNDSVRFRRAFHRPRPD